MGSRIARRIRASPRGRGKIGTPTTTPGAPPDRRKRPGGAFLVDPLADSPDLGPAMASTKIGFVPSRDEIGFVPSRGDGPGRPIAPGRTGLDGPTIKVVAGGRPDHTSWPDR